MTYEFRTEECAVLDKANLDLYRQKRSEWLRLLNDDDHAVWKQITSMLWNDAVFRAANEARRLSRKAGYPASSRNWTLAQFIDQGFVATQTLSIRKLMEKGSRNPARQIISLRRILDDIKDNRHLITRENYVSYDGLPYDPEPGERAYNERIAKQAKRGVYFGSLPTTGPNAWSMSQLVHEHFDRLSGKAPTERDRSDLISSDIFDKIEKTLDEGGWKNIVAYGNKYIAHAADKDSRELLENPDSGISLDKLSQCHERICQAANTISTAILWDGSHGMIPIPQFNHFENLEEPWLSGGDIQALSEFWDAHVDRVEAWTERDLLRE